MTDSLTLDQHALEEAIGRICADFGDDYWLARDTDGEFPEQFVVAIAAGGWLGIAMPETYGGAGLGVTEAALMMRRIAQSGGGFAAASSVHINIFGPQPIVKFASAEQQARMLPPLIRGEQRACFGVTEPATGLDTTRLKPRAVRDGDRYIVNGKKVWTSTAQVADKILLIARTTPIEDTARPADGLSLFYTDLDRNPVDVREIKKMGRHCVDSNELFIDGL